MIVQCRLPNAKQTSDQVECRLCPRAVGQEAENLPFSGATFGQKVTFTRYQKDGVQLQRPAMFQAIPPLLRKDHAPLAEKPM